jgi:uncharacterized protein
MNVGGPLSQSIKKVLRGCIGRMVADTPLEKIVRDMAMAAAFEDPRFPPLGKNEIGSIDLEISVLSPMEPCRPEDIVPGVHGAYLSKGYRSGSIPAPGGNRTGLGP